jgi:hypothetical protein
VASPLHRRCWPHERGDHEEQRMSQDVQTIATDELTRVSGGQTPPPPQLKQSEKECHLKAGFDGGPSVEAGPIKVTVPKPYIDVGCSETQYK